MLTRTIVGKPRPLSMIDESERLAYFAQSARTVDGKRAEYSAVLNDVADDEVECDHDWRLTDDSFGHQFGTERIEPYLECNCCGETRECDPPEY